VALVPDAKVEEEEALGATLVELGGGAGEEGIYGSTRVELLHTHKHTHIWWLGDEGDSEDMTRW
jgi:hypothetical protein